MFHWPVLSAYLHGAVRSSQDIARPSHSPLKLVGNSNLHCGFYPAANCRDHTSCSDTPECQVAMMHHFALPYRRSDVGFSKRARLALTRLHMRTGSLAAPHQSPPVQGMKNVTSHCRCESTQRIHSARQAPDHGHQSTLTTIWSKYIPNRQRLSRVIWAMGGFKPISTPAADVSPLRRAVF